MTKTEEKQLRKLIRAYHKAAQATFERIKVVIDTPIYKLTTHVSMYGYDTVDDVENTDIKFKNTKDKILSNVTIYDWDKLLVMVSEHPTVTNIIQNYRVARDAINLYIETLFPNWDDIEYYDADCDLESFEENVMDEVQHCPSKSVAPVPVTIKCSVSDCYDAIIEKGNPNIKVGCQTVPIENVRNILAEYDKLNS